MVKSRTISILIGKNKRLSKGQALVLVSALRWGIVYPLPKKGENFKVARGTDVDQYHSIHIIKRLLKAMNNHKKYLIGLDSGGYVLTDDGKQVANDLEAMELSKGLRCSNCNSYVWGEGKYHQWDLMWCDPCSEFTLWSNGKLAGVLA